MFGIFLLILIAYFNLFTSLPAMEAALRKFQDTNPLYLERLQNFFHNRLQRNPAWGNLLDKSNDSLNALARALDLLYPQIQPILDALANKDSQLNDLHEQRQKILEQLAQNKHQIETLNCGIIDLTIKEKNFTRENEEKNAELEKAQQLIYDAKKKYKTFKKENNRLHECILTKDLKIEELYAELYLGTQSIQELHREYQKKEKDFKDQLQHLEQEIRSNKDENHRKTQKIDTMVGGYKKIACLLSLIESSQLTQEQKSFINSIKNECQSHIS